MRRIVQVLLAIVVFVSVLSFSKNIIAKAAISVGIRSVTGLGLRLDSIDIGILTTKVDVKGLVILNPSGFTDKMMASIPEIYIDYDLGALLFKKKVHIDEIRLDIEEFVAVKNAAGELNLNSLKIKDSGAVKQKKEPTGKGFSPEEIKIDKLNLKIGKIVYKDYSAGGAPTIKEFDLNINEEYRDIDDVNTLVKLIMYRAVMKSPLSKLVNMDLSVITNGLEMPLKTLSSLTGGATDETLVAGKEVGKAATDTATAAVEALKGVFSFGSKEE